MYVEWKDDCLRLLCIKGGDDRFDNINRLHGGEEKLVKPMTRY
jgi:hypothetical protein